MVQKYGPTFSSVTAKSTKNEELHRQLQIVIFLGLTLSRSPRGASRATLLDYCSD